MGIHLLNERFKYELYFYKRMVNTSPFGYLGAGSIYIMGSSKKRKRKSTKRKVKSRKKRNNYKTKKQKKPYTAGKRRDTSKRRIRYTKNNQPYIIMANGRARFIKKSSVKNSRKRKGGRY